MNIGRRDAIILAVSWSRLVLAGFGLVWGRDLIFARLRGLLTVLPRFCFPVLVANSTA